MNKQAYRVVFNVCRGTLMAVAENVSSQGKSTSESTGGAASASIVSTARSGWMRLAQLGVAIAVLFGGVTVVSAQIVADRNAASRPVVDQSANGKPVVQIVTPNAAGVSHNRYDQFNVGQGGAILNNSSTLTQTQQAGYIAGNAALTNGSARLILNEVTGASRSQLNGYVEVAGQRAEVIIANPNGISCSGCGFINTSRGVLTTGTPEFAADGSLANLRVTRGNITIDSMNASAIDRVDLIARSVQVNGELWGDQLNVVTGANLVNYANLGVQVIQGDGAKPTVGIDLAQMGGMYANKIRLVGTEAGVGVRSMGNIAAQAGDISIDNSGRITLNGNTTSSGKIVINGGDDVSNSGNLYAQQSVQVTATGSLGNTGVLAAQTDIVLQARDITSSNSIAAGLDASGNPAASGNLSLSTTGAIDNSGGKLYAKDNLTLRSGANLTNSNGVIQSDGSIDAAAIGALANDSGRIEANGATATLKLAAASLDNSAGRIVNSGTGLTQISGGSQIVNTNAARVAGRGLIGGNGNVALASTAMNNGVGGQISVGSDLSLQFSTLDNTGDIAATRDLSVTVTNALTNTGSFSAVRDLSLSADSVDNSGLMNAGAKTIVRAATSVRNVGRIYGDDVAIGAQTLTNDVDSGTNIAGVIAARNTMQIGATQIVNREHALLQSLGDMTIAGALDVNNQATGSAASILNDSATIDAGGNLSLQTASLINRNNHFSTTIQDDAALTRSVTEYAYWDQPDVWYTADRVTWSDSGDGGIVLVLPNGDRFEKFYKRDYTEVVQKTVVLSSDPGKISSGGNMLLSGNVTNDKSIMVAGGTLSGVVGAINNIGATGTATTIDHMTAGQNYYHWVDGHPHQNHYTYNQGGAAYDNVLASTTLDLPVWSIQQNTTPATLANSAVNAGAPNAGNSIAAIALPPLVFPNNPLFKPGQTYVVETDPKFTDYKTFVSSDYMLSRLAVDPQTIQKRLGDGFYEQKLIGDQITQLTGRRTLGAYTTSEDQYKALMDAGVATATQFHLTPGIALTDAQMAALTSDIVWLVERDVTLPDGTQTKALAPVVYLSRVSTEDIGTTGSLVSAKDIDLTINGSLNNGGTLLASNSLIVQATDIQNTGSVQSSDAAGTVSLTASNDVTSSGSISGNRVGILAGRDVNLITTTTSNMATDGLNTKIDKVSSINADQLSVRAVRDINLTAAAINTESDASLVAVGNLNLNTVKTQDSYNVTFNSDNHLNESATQVFGTVMNVGTTLALSAGQDINAQAAYANAGGQLAIVAGHDINVGAARQGTSLDQAIYTTSKGFLSSSSSRSQQSQQSTTSVGSILSGNSVVVQAGNDIVVAGSAVVGTNDVSLKAGGNVEIISTQNTLQSYSKHEEKSSGFTASFGSGVASIGYSKASANGESSSEVVTQQGSSIASLTGNTQIQAGQKLSVVASDIGAGKDLTLIGASIDLSAAQNTSVEHSEQQSSVSGFSVGATYNPIAAFKSAYQQSAKNNPSTSFLGKSSKYGDAIGDGSLAATTPVVVQAGMRSASSTQDHAISVAQVSTLNAGNNLTLLATGGGITSQGTSMSAEGDALLIAKNDIILDVARSFETQGQTSVAKGWSLDNRGSLPVGIFNNNGNGDGTTTTINGTSLSAGRSVSISSTEGNVALTAANLVANGDLSISAAKNLTIQSGQDVLANANQNNNQAVGKVVISDTERFSGYHTEKSQGDNSAVTQVASNVGSLQGNVSLNAGETYTQTASNVLAANNVDINAKAINITTADNTGSNDQSSSSLKIGAFARVSSPLIDLANNIENATKSDGRLQAMQGLAAAANGYQAVSAMASGTLIKGEVGIGFATANSQDNSRTVQAQGSTIQGGGNVNLTSTVGDIHATGASISAGDTLTLDSARNILLDAGKSSVVGSGDNHSAGVEIGVGYSVGAQTGIYAYISANIGNGRYDYNALTNSNTQLSGDTVTLKSQGDTTLNGAAVNASTINTIAAGKLTIESVQDQITQHSEQSNIGGRVQISIGTAWEASGSLSQSTANGSSSFVNQQSGLFAGDGGYHVTADNVALKGGAITSSNAGNSDFTANAISIENIANKMEYSASTMSVSGGFGSGDKAGNKADSQGGTSSQDVVQTSTPILTSGPQGPNLTPGIILQDSGSASSTTYGTLTDGKIKIGGQATSSAADLGAHTDLATANNAIAALPDLRNVMKEQQAMAAAANTVIATSAQIASDIANNLAKAAADRNDTEAVKNWGPTGDYTRALKTVTAVLVGGLAGQSAGQLAASASGPYIANAIGDYFSQPGNENKTAQILSHAVLGGILAAATGGSAGAGAVAGAAGELAAQAISRELYPDAYDADGTFHPEKLDARQLNTVIALSTAAGMVLGGITGGTTLDTVIGGNVASNAATNNWLSQKPNGIKRSEQEQYDAAVLACSPANQGACDRAQELRTLSAQRDAVMRAACSGGPSEDCTSQVSKAIKEGNNVVFNNLGRPVAYPQNSPEIKAQNDPRAGAYVFEQGASLLEGLQLVAADTAAKLVVSGIWKLGSGFVSKYLTGMTDVAGAVVDGSGGATSLSKTTIPYQPSGTVIMQGDAPVCGPACAAMTITDNTGISVNLSDAIGSFTNGIRPTGVNPIELASVISKAGVQNTLEPVMLPGQLNQALQNGKAVIVQVPAGDGYHFIIVDSVKTVDGASYYMTRDPSAGPRGVLTSILDNVMSRGVNAIVVGK